VTDDQRRSEVTDEVVQQFQDPTRKIDCEEGRGGDGGDVGCIAGIAAGFRADYFMSVWSGESDHSDTFESSRRVYVTS
jgi:hypothetical protein